MSRIEQLFEQLGYTRENGLFYLEESDQWLGKFPFRISKVLKDVIQPYAFYSLHHHGDEASEHPEPINNPIILFFDKPDEKKTREIPKWAFCFGQAPIVIINKDDHSPLDIYHGYQFESDYSYQLKNLETDINVFSLINLTLGKTWKTLYNQYFKNVPKVDKYLLNNIIDARRILIASDGYGLLPKIANRLIGRLLFIRYLIDRNVEFSGQQFLLGDDKLTRQQNLNDMIKSKESLYDFFEYLNSKFSGDLFPLKEEVVDEDTGEVFTSYDEKEHVEEGHLEVLHYLFSGSSFFKSGAAHKGYFVQKSLFMMYDFEIIPVELISNIYENFIGKEEENLNVVLENFNTKSKQYDIKAYYTPPFVVDYILSQTVSPYLERSKTSDCKVLDPSCGSGIFLVETLRKIIEKEIQCCPPTMGGLSNDRLWELIKNNIFGIDIDEDAIEITIFSLYITLLDYKSPKEIEDFKFERLKHINLFGGRQYDFFNEEAAFNELFSKQTALDFIIGNPPWGVVKMSCYEKYIENRRHRELQSSNEISLKIIAPELPLEIGNNEISQAFLVRVSDFALNPNLEIALVVTGKSLYNSAVTTKNWREYFLSNFILNQVLELSGVNNKIVGGSQIFEGAKMAPAIFFYRVAKSSGDIISNVVTHITVKPNRFFNYFRTIVIEKHDIKKVLQRNFVPKLNGHDWLWKVLLHGNVLDFYFMLRLKSYQTIKDLMDEYNLDYKGGLKIKDAANKRSTSEISNFLFLNVEPKKEFKQYHAAASMTWEATVRELLAKNKNKLTGRNLIDDEGNVGFLPDPYYFRGEKLLIKKGLEATDDFKAVAAYTDKNIAFTSTVCSIKTKPGFPQHQNTSLALKSLTGIVNSNFFTYYLLQTSSSAGIDRTRVDFKEIFSAPATVNSDLADLVVSLQDKHLKLSSITELDYTYNEKLSEINDLEKRVDSMVCNVFSFSEVEKSLINYSTTISLPILKRAEETGYGKNNIFRALLCDNESDVFYLTSYADIFINHFKHRFNSAEKSFFANIYIAEDFIGFQFVVGVLPKAGQYVYFKDTDDSRIFDEIGNLGMHSVTRDLYIQQDVRGFSKNTFYIIKPNEFKCWHEAVANHDLIEFIDALAKAEVKISNKVQS